MADMVNHPPHYTTHPSGVECIVVTQHMDFLGGNAFKYVFRALNKGNPLQDYRKALWYCERAAERKSPEILLQITADVADIVRAEKETARAYALCNIWTGKFVEAAIAIRGIINTLEEHGNGSN